MFLLKNLIVIAIVSFFVTSPSWAKISCSEFTEDCIIETTITNNSASFDEKTYFFKSFRFETIKRVPSSSLYLVKSIFTIDQGGEGGKIEIYNSNESNKFRNAIYISLKDNSAMKNSSQLSSSTVLRGTVNFALYDNSYLSLSIIRDRWEGAECDIEDCIPDNDPTLDENGRPKPISNSMLSLTLVDSKAVINQINLAPDKSTIQGIDLHSQDGKGSEIHIYGIETPDDGRLAIQASSIDQGFKAVDSLIQIDGDIIAGRIGFDSVSDYKALDLTESDFLFKGDYLGYIAGTISLTNGSKFDASKDGSTIAVRSPGEAFKDELTGASFDNDYEGSLFEMYISSSEFYAKNMIFAAPKTNIYLLLFSKFNVEHISFADQIYIGNQPQTDDLQWNILFSSGTEANIGTLDLRTQMFTDSDIYQVGQIGAVTNKFQFTLNNWVEEESPKIEIGDMFVDSNMLIYFNNVKGLHIKNLFYDKTNLLFFATDDNVSQHQGLVNIDNLSFDGLNQTNTNFWQMSNININITDKFTVKNAKKIEWYVNKSSTINIGDFLCKEACQDILITGDGTSSIYFGSFLGAKDYNESNKFVVSEVNIDVSGTLWASGKFTVKDNGKISTRNFFGTFDYIDILNGGRFEINSNKAGSGITFTGDPTQQCSTERDPFADCNYNMYIGSGSALTINVADIFKTPELTHIYNGGELNIMQDQGSMEHSIAEIYNAEGGILSISGYVYVDNLENYGITRLYQGSYIKGFNNKERGILEIWGRTYINNLNNNENSSIHFRVQDSPTEEYASMQVENFEGKINRDNLDLDFMKTSVFKVGKDNLYELINVKNGETGIADGLKDDALANTKADPMCENITGNINEWSEYCQSKYTGELNNLINHAMWGRTDPPWLKREYSMEQNIDASGNVNGESFYINIERLINYKGILDGIGVSDDFLNQISDVLDRSVDDLTVTDAMQDIYNSLDYNSGCVGQSPDEGEFIDGAHNNTDNTTDDTEIDYGGDKFNDWGNPCLQNLANNMKKLRPLDMEVFMFAHHNNTNQAIRAISQENKAYYGVKEFHIWQRSTFNSNSFRAKEGYAGYKGMNGIVQLGVSGSIANNWNFTGAVGLNLGNMVDDSYSSVLLGNQLGVSLSYFSSYYYVSLSSMYNLTNYSNTRDVDFMNNQYVQNKETRAMSDMLMQELAFQIEAGTGLSAWRISFDPKIILGASLINTPNFTETGSSASYDYQSTNTPLIETGIGLDVYKETLANSILWVENIFVRPHSGLSFTKYIYPSTATNVNFVGQSADYLMQVKGAGYSTLFSNINLGVKFEKDNAILDISYGLEHNFSNYINNSIQLSFKYVL